MSRRQLPPQIRKLDVTDRRTGKTVVRYQLTVDAGVDPETGKRRQVRRRYARESEAREALTEIAQQARSGTFVPKKSTTVETLCADWLLSLHSASETTIAGYGYNLAPLRERHGDLLVQQLTRAHVDQLIVDLRAGGTKTAKGNTRRPWGTRGLKRTAETTAMVLAYGVERRIVQTNVAAAVKVSNPRRERQTFIDAEVKAFLDHIDGDRQRHLFHMALWGMRRSEILGLRWSDVDLASGLVTLRQGRKAAGGKAVEGGLKTAAAARTLPLSTQMQQVLKRAQREMAKEKLALGAAYLDEGYIACDEAGRPMHPDTLSHRWLKQVRAAGVKQISLHDARHTAATAMLLNGAPLPVVAAWLGHADPSVTARLYAHSQDDALKAAANTLSQVVVTTS